MLIPFTLITYLLSQLSRELMRHIPNKHVGDTAVRQFILDRNRIINGMNGKT